MVIEWYFSSFVYFAACSPQNNVRIVQHNLADRPNGRVELTCLCSGVRPDDIEYFWWLIDDTNSPLYTYSVSVFYIFWEQNICLSRIVIFPTDANIYIYMYVCMYVCMYIHIMCEHVCVWVYTCVCICVFVCSTVKFVATSLQHAIYCYNDM